MSAMCQACFFCLPEAIFSKIKVEKNKPFQSRKQVEKKDSISGAGFRKGIPKTGRCKKLKSLEIQRL